MEQQAQGFIEVTGLVPAIDAADIMLKAADVTIVAAHKVDGPRICVICQGATASCRAAVDAAESHCAANNTLIAANVIPRPADESPPLRELLGDIAVRKAARKAARKRCGAAEQAEKRPAAPKAAVKK